MPEGDELNSMQIDALTEAGNIGAGHAATSLSKMLGEHVMNESTTSMVLPLDKVPAALGGAEKVFAGIYTTFAGELTGGMLMLFPEKSAAILSNVLCGENIKCYDLTDVQNSMLCEVGNICLCWYLNALAKMIGIEIIPTPTLAAYDMIGAVIDLPLIELGKVADSAFLVITNFKGEVNEIEGIFLLLPDPESQKKILEKLGVG